MALDKQQLEQLLKSLRDAGIATGDYERKLREAEAAGRSNVSIIQEMERALRNVDDTASSLYEQLRNITSEIGRKNDSLNRAKGAYRQLTNAASDLRNDEQSVVDLNRSQLESLKQKVQINQQALEDEAIRLRNGEGLSKEVADRVKALQGELDKEENIKKSAEERLDLALEYLNTIDDLKEDQKVILLSLYDQNGAASKLNDAINDRLVLERKISEAMGVTGALVTGAGALMERLGMRSGIFHDAMRDASEEMRHQAKLLKGNVTSLDKLRIGAKGFGILIKGFSAALFDPAVIIGKILDGFLDVNKASVELGRLTGQNASSLAGYNSTIATTVDMLETASEFTKQTGLAASSVFSPADIARISEAKNLLGLSAEQASNLGLRSKVAAQGIEEYQDNILKGVDAGNKLAKSAVAPGLALQDALNASDAITASFGRSTDILGKAATAARALGLELSKVDRIAESLLDFESSIEAELEAQLLTGKQLNLAKARELALNNDLVGLSQELAKNGVLAAEFANMNRIQQNALAKSLGMSREELAKTVLTQEASRNLTDEQRAAVLGVTREQLQQMDVQEKLNKSLQKLAQAFAPALDLLIPIVDLIGAIIRPVAGVVSLVMEFANGLTTSLDKMFGLNESSNELEGGFKSIAKILTSLPKLIAGAGILLVGKSIKDAFNPKLAGGFFKAIKRNFSSIGGLFDKLKGSAQETAQSTLQDKGKELLENKGEETAESLADKAKEKLTGKTEDLTGQVKTEAIQEPKTSGQKIREFLTNLSEGLKSMGQQGVLKGALNLIPASIGFIAFIPGMVGVKLAEQINGTKLATGLQGLAAGLTAMQGTLKGSLALGAAALAFTAMIPGAVGMLLFSAAAGPTAAALNTLGPALVSFGSMMMTGVGAIGLAALAAAAISLGAALRLAAPAITAAGGAIASILTSLTPIVQIIGDTIVSVFKQIPGIITAVADGFTNMFSSISMSNIVPIAMLGPALLSASAGMLAFTSALAGASIVSGLSSLMGGGVLGSLEKLANMAQPLSTVGMSLTAIATGIAGIAAALATLETEKLDEIKDLVVTTAFAAPAIAASGAITELISGLTGGSQEQSSNKELVDKMNELIAAVKAGGDVYMDGSKVGQALVLASTKLS